MKEKDLEYIKQFSQITITQICKDLNINRGNVLNGTASEKNIKLVKEELQKRLTTLNG